MNKSYVESLAAVALPLLLVSSASGQQQLQRAALPTPVPDVVSRSQDLGHSNPDQVLSMAVSLPYRDAAGVQAFVDGVSDPSSPTYRQFLTPEEVGARFGLTEKDVQSVVDFLKSEGFTITLVGKNRLSILAEGTVAQAEHAFGTSIHEFQALKNDEPGNLRYFSHVTAPTLPQAIAPLVIDITGLESFTKPQHRILTPTQTRTLYGVAPMYTAGTQGQGRTVGISNFDGFRLTNVPLYYSHFSLPTPPGGLGSNVTVVTVSGGAGAGSPGGEGDLDIQMPLGMAPLCNLKVYDGGSSNLIGVLTLEANDNAADVISESYGWNISTSTANSAHNLHVSMSAQGITYMAASGDSGTTIEPFSYPNYDPEVLMVGGTVATANSSGNRTSEVGWSGSGGGWSTKAVAFNVLPSWQHGTGVPTGNNHRLSPDVALSASGSSGAYYFYDNGSLTTGAVGTSFASPVFAGCLAAAEQKIIALGGLPANGAGKQRFGRIQDLFYSQNGRSDVWFDVTSGSNGTLPSGSTSQAGAGWDYVTGWGAINFNAFVTAFTCVSPTINSNGQPADQTVCASGVVSLSVGAAGTSPSYQWQIQTVAPPNETWVNLTTGAVALPCGGTAQATSPTGASTNVTITPCSGSPGESQQFLFRCAISNGCGSVTSSNATITLCPADFNCDGFVDFFDFSDFISCFEGSSCAAGENADFNGDDFVDFFDFADFITAFEAGCN